MEIRPAGPADAEAIGRVHALSRTAAYDGLVPPQPFSPWIAGAKSPRIKAA